MALLRLNGPQLLQLRDLLKAAFPDEEEFEDFLLLRLDRKTSDFAGRSDRFPVAIRKVLIRVKRFSGR